MFRDEKNLKDTQAPTGTALKDSPFPISYSKTNKLITALYMVTDIIDLNEPVRARLRTVGLEILSDIFSAPGRASSKTGEMLALLELAQTMSIISPMNAGILLREFGALDQSLKEATGALKKSIDLEEFLREELPAPADGLYRGQTRLGVQKGGTLLRALSGVGMPARSMGADVSDKNFHKTAGGHAHLSDIHKRQRKDEILNTIKNLGGSATIKDIKDKISLVSDKNNPLYLLGEKTLQRELVSLVHDSVLLKQGEKRWSRYCVI